MAGRILLWPPGFWVKYCMSDIEQKHNKNHSATILKLAPPPKNNNEKKALVNLIKQKKMRKKKKKILLGKIQNVVMATAAQGPRSNFRCVLARRPSVLARLGQQRLDKDI